ncbi:hypothetical protein SDC9_138911 [bioreactor metagenome]|uniref:Uncharacterized protein n=1 Tax=bioreactor metagenome TaxID=1076179 RepID=A0A645DR21_9ZZZZ
MSNEHGSQPQVGNADAAAQQSRKGCRQCGGQREDLCAGALGIHFATDGAAVPVLAIASTGATDRVVDDRSRERAALAHVVGAGGHALVCLTDHDHAGDGQRDDQADCQCDHQFHQAEAAVGLSQMAIECGKGRCDHGQNSGAFRVTRVASRLVSVLPRDG